MVAISSVRKDIRSAPRVGVEIFVRPGWEYFVRQVTNEREEESNSVVQSLTIEMRGGVSLTGAYVSPCVSEGREEEFLKQGGKNVIMGDLHARHYLWDMAANSKGRALVKRDEWKQV